MKKKELEKLLTERTIELEEALKRIEGRGHYFTRLFLKDFIVGSLELNRLMLDALKKHETKAA